MLHGSKLDFYQSFVCIVLKVVYKAIVDPCNNIYCIVVGRYCIYKTFELQCNLNLELPNMIIAFSFCNVHRFHACLFLVNVLSVSLLTYINSHLFTQCSLYYLEYKVPRMHYVDSTFNNLNPMQLNIFFHTTVIRTCISTSNPVV